MAAVRFASRMFALFIAVLLLGGAAYLNFTPLSSSCGYPFSYCYYPSPSYDPWQRPVAALLLSLAALVLFLGVTNWRRVQRPIPDDISETRLGRL